MTSYARRQRQRERRIGSLPREGEIVVPIQRFLHVLVFVIGLILTLFGVTMLVGLGTGAVKPASIVLVPGVFFLAVSLRPILSSSSQLRADADGIELGHCPKLSWSGVRAVYPTQPDTVVFQIDRRRAFRHLPLGTYLRSLLTGTVSLNLATGSPHANIVASQLDGMRVCALGVDENLRVAGDAELPAARIVKR